MVLFNVSLMAHLKNGVRTILCFHITLQAVYRVGDRQLNGNGNGNGK